jgi:hypothetical protein
VGRSRPTRSAPSCWPRTTRPAPPVRGCGTCACCNCRYAATADGTRACPPPCTGSPTPFPATTRRATGRRSPAHPRPADDLDILRAALHQPELRLIAWAVCYDDLLADDEDLATVRRVETVDVDGRVYQLSLHPNDTHPVVLIDEQPDPDDLPATYPPLARLATAAQPARA